MYNELRKEIKARFPLLKFKVGKVSFAGFGYGDGISVTSDDWTPEIFRAVQEIAKGHGAIASY